MYSAGDTFLHNGVTVTVTHGTCSKCHFQTHHDPTICTKIGCDEDNNLIFVTTEVMRELPIKHSEASAPTPRFCKVCGAPGRTASCDCTVEVARRVVVEEQGNMRFLMRLISSTETYLAALKKELDDSRAVYLAAYCKIPQNVTIVKPHTPKAAPKQTLNPLEAAMKMMSTLSSERKEVELNKLIAELTSLRTGGK